MSEGAVTADFPEVKRALRQRIIALRDALTPELRRAHSERICAAILKLEAYREARRVAGYMSFGSELETRSLLEQVLADGKRLALPRIDSGMTHLELYEVEDLAADLKPGPWGIAEPDPQRCRKVADLKEFGFILVPGVAFGVRGERLGYGKGYYDQLLRRAGDGIPRIAGAFSLQVADGIPMGPLDQPVHRVVTESGHFDTT